MLYTTELLPPSLKSNLPNINYFIAHWLLCHNNASKNGATVYLNARKYHIGPFQPWGAVCAINLAPLSTAGRSVPGAVCLLPQGGTGCVSQIFYSGPFCTKIQLSTLGDLSYKICFAHDRHINIWCDLCVNSTYKERLVSGFQPKWVQTWNRITQQTCIFSIETQIYEYWMHEHAQITRLVRWWTYISHSLALSRPNNSTTPSR